ncbi:hypothetical protein GVN20_02070 [Runella sp. CRIBMP]|uniref:hypothetical protein n=1 Tax=Runella sp. CRIBMP TaxID=2683261 RepID=UPI00141320D2|nr:hypothetical protein [Runella sp. CRIBMP]NBB18128.1 hypothetical protein [Runella sp. CRIBMP]
MTITKALIFILLFLIQSGCERKDIIEAYNFTDMSKVRYFFYKIQREDSVVDINVKGYMDGSLGFGKTICGDTTEFKASQIAISVAPPFDSLYKQNFALHSDSINIKRVEEGTSSGITLAVMLVPGTAKKGKIEVVFREHGYGF